MKEAGVIEPLRVKVQALQSVGEVAEMILRIDDIIAARNALPQLMLTSLEMMIVECLQ